MSTEPAEAGGADVVADHTVTVVVLGGPVTIHCHAIGWPRPSVTWWRGDRMLPFFSAAYEQHRDFSLLVRSVTFRDLGPYTCQAYNGYGRPSSYTVVLQAIGPVYSVDDADLEFRRYLIPAPLAPVDPWRAAGARPRPPPPRSPARRIDRPLAVPQRPAFGKVFFTQTGALIFFFFYTFLYQFFIMGYYQCFYLNFNDFYAVLNV